MSALSSLTAIDLMPYLKANEDYARMSKGLLINFKLPALDMPDGPTWNDRVKRAEKIAAIVNTAQEDLEEAFLDLRESLLSKIIQSAPPGCRLEGTTLYAPEGTILKD